MGEQLVLERPCRRRIEDDLHARGAGDSSSVLHGLDRHLQLQQEDGGRLDRLSRGLDIGHAQVGDDTRRNRDQVLACFVDQDQGDAGWCLLVPEHESCLDSLALEAVERLIAERVGADSGDQRDLGAQAGCGDRLVRSLPSGDHQKGPAQHRLAW